MLPLLLTVAWVTGMSLSTTDIFWDNYSNSGTIYIIVLPMILALTVGKLGYFFNEGQGWYLISDKIMKSFKWMLKVIVAVNSDHGATKMETYRLLIRYSQANLIILISIMRVVVIKLQIQRSLSTQQLQVIPSPAHPNSSTTIPEKEKYIIYLIYIRSPMTISDSALLCI